MRPAASTRTRPRGSLRTDPIPASRPTRGRQETHRMRYVTTPGAASRHVVLLGCLACALPTARAAPPPPGAPESAGMSRERLRRIDDVIGRYIEAKKVAGAVTLVARGGLV